MSARVVGAVVAALLVLSSCGGGSDSPAKSSGSKSPSPVDVTVNLHDAPPIDALYNKNNRVCSSQSFMDAIAGQDSKVTVTLKDASGTIVGTQDLPKEGGTFDKTSGCDWAVTFEQVAPSDFYQAEVTSNHDLNESGQAQTEGTTAEISIDF